MVALSGVLLHLTTLAQWASAAVTGTYGADQVSAGGFVHMSTADQVAGPANRLFAGRTDVWLLVIDADRLPVAPRWEAGDPPAAGEQFPHLYAPLPARAVVAAVPYPTGPDGRFGRPADLPEPDDQLERAHALEWYLARAGETLDGKIGAHVPVRHRGVGRTDQHNRLVLRGDQTPAEAARLCAEELGAERWHVRIVGPIAAATISAFEWASWSHAENLLMVASATATRDPDPGVAVTATPDEAAVDSPDSLRRDLPRLLDPELRHLVEREAVTSGVARHLHLAVLDDGGQPLSEVDVLIAGATAQIDNMITRPDQRGRGLATAVVLEAVQRAHAIGCDVVFLRTAAGDGPWRTYERLGFRAIESAHDFDRAAFAP